MREKYKMARFSTVSDEDLEKLIQEKDAKNTKRVISVQYNIFEQYCKEKKINMDIQTIEKRAKFFLSLMFKFMKNYISILYVSIWCLIKQLSIRKPTDIGYI